MVDLGGRYGSRIGAKLPKTAWEDRDGLTRPANPDEVLKAARKGKTVFQADKPD